MNVFETVKQSIGARDAADLYGIEVRGNGMACCPFHDDRTPSMKVDERFHCFGCGADGDAIDLTAKLFDLSPKQAAEKLAQDFGLSYDHRKIEPGAYRAVVQRRNEAKAEKERAEAVFRLVVSYFHDLRDWERTYAPQSPDDPLHPLYAEAISQKDHIEYLLDLMLSAGPEEKKVLIAENESLIANLEKRRNEPMAEKQTNKEKLREITDSIEQGIKDLFQSDKYRQYLSVMSRFHRYSLNNTMLIYLQKPDATLVAGYNKWKNQFERHVKKGEHGITIIAPTPFKKKIEEQKLDPDTKAPMLDKEGNIITEEKEIEIPMFRPVKVFDVSQTDGKPLPQLAASLSGSVQNYEVFMEALKRSAPVPLEFEPMSEDTDGYFSPRDQRIAIRSGMSEVQTVSAAVHEITHSKLHNYEKNGTEKKDHHTEEVEAESVSYAVCQYYGIQTGENSFGYIAGWSQGKELPELKASLETINKTAGELIGDIDRHYQEISKERGIVPQERAVPAQEAELDKSKWRCYVIPDLMTWNAPALRVQREAAEQLIGRIDYLGSNGAVGESIEYSDARELEVDLRYNSGCGAPMSVVLYQNSTGEVISHDYMGRLDPPPKSVQVIENPALRKVPSERTPIEFFDSFEEAAARFQELRTQEYNRDEIIDPQSDMPYARLAFGVQREDPPSAVDLLHVRAGQNYLVDDFTRMETVNTSPEVMEILYRMDRELGFDRINLHEKGEDGKFLPPVDMPFSQWDNSYFEPQPEAPTQQLDTYPAVDSVVESDALEKCGYLDGDLLPLSRERAYELMERDMTVYMIESGKSPELAFDADDLDAHNGVFAVSKEEWEQSLEFHTLVLERLDRQAEREQAFLNCAEDCFAIYQVRHDDPENIRYMNLDWMNQHNIPVARENYDLIYTAPLTAEGSMEAALETIYNRFNLDHPADYHSASLSASDIVAVKQNGVLSCHYVDSVGFLPVEQFLKENPLKAVEMTVEDDYGMIDGVINNGPREPVKDRREEKKSLVDRLKEMPKRAHRESHTKKKAEREI